MGLGKVRKQLGRIGVWSREMYFDDPDEATNLATVAEELGYGALWIPGYDGGPIFERCRLALEATSSDYIIPRTTSMKRIISGPRPRHRCAVFVLVQPVPVPH